MTKHDVVDRLLKTGLIAIVRTGSAEQAVAVVEAVREGGIDCIEVAMTVPGALEVLRQLKGRHGDNLLLGAGTVLDPETARQAILAGASYIISPCLNIPTITIAARYQAAAIPGCQTVTEAMTALEAGADLIKLFPAEVLGPGYLKAVRAALPQIPYVPTGGIGLHNVREWIAAGAVAVAVGGELTRAGDAAQVTATAARLRDAVREARGEGGR